MNLLMVIVMKSPKVNWNTCSDELRWTGSDLGSNAWMTYLIVPSVRQYAACSLQFDYYNLSGSI